MLHVPIKHIHKSLVNINEKNVLLYQLFFNRNSTKKTKTTLFYVNFVELLSILDLSFLYKHTIRS